MDNRIERISKILKEKNFKLTSTRREIIKVFLSSNRHLKPEEVYDLVKTKNVSLPTVYRTIDILKNNGIIKEITINKDRYYELKIFSEKCMHIHLKCEKCEKIYDLNDTNQILDLIELKNYTEKRFGAVINDVSVVMKGICSKCKGGEQCRDQ